MLAHLDGVDFLTLNLPFVATDTICGDELSRHHIRAARHCQARAPKAHGDAQNMRTIEWY